MLEPVERLISWLRAEIIKLLIFGGVLLLFWGIISPVETLEWWIQQGSQSLGLTQTQLNNFAFNNDNTSYSNSSNIRYSQYNCYIVYLPGVGDFSNDEITRGEDYFLDLLVEMHPECVAVRDVFPYSADNRSLGAKRLLTPLWRFAYEKHEAKSWLGFIDVFLKIRNLWRFALSADPRYGKIYNRGIAAAIVERMDAEDALPRNNDQRIKVILLGTSGGAQVALGASPYLQRTLPNANIILVSVGGVFNSDDGFDVIQHFYHLRGTPDLVQALGSILFPARWPWSVGSPYNRAKRQGRYTVSIIGPQAHDGPKGYFSEELIQDMGIPYVDLTLQQVNQLPLWQK